MNVNDTGASPGCIRYTVILMGPREGVGVQLKREWEKYLCCPEEFDASYEVVDIGVPYVMTKYHKCFVDAPHACHAVHQAT